MISNVKKGNYYKAKTKKYFIKLGYQTEYIEKLQGIKTPHGILYIKKDLFFSDGLSISKDGKIIFWQSKLGRKNIADAVHKYKGFCVCAKKVVVIWEKRARDPELIWVE